jgi:hypothetical protein
MKGISQKTNLERTGELPGCGYEETLRLLASLPAPDGLAERVQASLQARGAAKARILRWPARLGLGQLWMQSGQMHGLKRGLAAAAIVVMVAGGGWGVYSRVRPSQPARGIALPHVGAPGGFAGAGAMRTPQTLNAPAVAHPVVAAPQTPVAPAKQTAHRRGKSALANKLPVAPAAPAAK